MGIHHLWDNADIDQCDYLIEEITSHRNGLLADLRDIRRKNGARRTRRNKGEEDVSDDESYGDNEDHLDEACAGHTFWDDVEEEEEEKKKMEEEEEEEEEKKKKEEEEEENTD